ncbi:peptidyl-prolyl cis-trans isomerase fkbp4-like protein [Chrysochromulina tobinii]|uniref:Peptidyl-prolyl cis-trans isomerase fkbp4-like protein n=1 Tax=Chrysochromulina tobinii TaxID=1460289 RepID=A0A0M0JY23_9EUKA|nr:peptidyl-prolyl cis-trans isomerase fkbp4-like protein [Chrysochromulina tobinii]|eukprot:KOO31556.1 peptidyl-prolyl cis-trans isomerase fkbp4-like protein [Chrysochromulina sp. CCMP291]
MVNAQSTALVRQNAALEAALRERERTIHNLRYQLGHPDASHVLQDRPDATAMGSAAAAAPKRPAEWTTAKIIGLSSWACVLLAAFTISVALAVSAILSAAHEHGRLVAMQQYAPTAGAAAVYNQPSTGLGAVLGVRRELADPPPSNALGAEGAATVAQHDVAAVAQHDAITGAQHKAPQAPAGGVGAEIEVDPSKPPMSDEDRLAQAGSLKAAANAQYKQGDVAGACAEYERARALVEPVAETSVEKAPLLLALRLNSANCALQAKSFVDALAHTDAAIALSPQSVKAHFRRGQALQALGRVPEAEAAYSEVLKLEPANREVGAKLHDLQHGHGLGHGQGHAHGAAAASEAAPVNIIEAAPVNIIKAAAGTAGGAGGLPWKVQSVAVEMTAEEPSKPPMSDEDRLAQAGSLKAAANAQYKQGDVAGACAEYERARALVEPVAETSVEKAPLLLALRLNSANCALQAKSFVDALAHTDAAIALSPQSVKAHFRRGQALQALGRVPEAEAAYSEVLKLEPANREVGAKLQELRS